MTWTYSGNPKDSEKDLYRFLLSDTDEGAPVLSDEELVFMLEEYPDKNTRLYHMFTAAADRFNREIKRSLGPQSEDPTSRGAYFAKKADSYKGKIASTGGFNSVVHGKPIFKIGMNDNV